MIDVTEFIDNLSTVLWVFIVPIGLLIGAKAALKILEERKYLEKPKKEGEYSYKDVPKQVEGDRENVVRVCITIEENGEIKNKTLMPKHISNVVKQNLQFYPKEEFYKAYPRDGSAIYEYLIVDKLKTTHKKTSGVTTDYMVIQNIIDPITENKKDS